MVSLKGKIKNLHCTIDKLQAYQDVATGDRLAFATITMDTYRRIFAHFSVGQNHSLNNIGNVIKNLKTFTCIGHKLEIHYNAFYLDDDFRTPRE